MSSISFGNLAPSGFLTLPNNSQPLWPSKGIVFPASSIVNAFVLLYFSTHSLGLISSITPLAFKSDPSFAGGSPEYVLLKYLFIFLNAVSSVIKPASTYICVTSLIFCLAFFDKLSNSLTPISYLISPSSILYNTFFSSGVNCCALCAILIASNSILPRSPPKSRAFNLAISLGNLNSSTKSLPRYVAIDISSCLPTAVPGIFTVLKPLIPAAPAIKPNTALFNLVIVLPSSSGKENP